MRPKTFYLSLVPPHNVARASFTTVEPNVSPLKVPFCHASSAHFVFAERVAFCIQPIQYLWNVSLTLNVLVAIDGFTCLFSNVAFEVLDSAQ